jgi:hypothetical protein
MKNVTVSMDEAILAEAKVKAAQAGQSLSKYMAGFVEADVGSVRLPGTAACSPRRWNSAAGHSCRKICTMGMRSAG